MVMIAINNFEGMAVTAWNNRGIISMLRAVTVTV